MKKAAVLGFMLATCLGLLVLAISKHHTKDSASGSKVVETDEYVPPPVSTSPSRPLPSQNHRAAPPAPKPDNEDKGSPAPLRTHEDVARMFENAFRADQPPNTNSTKRTAAIVAAFSDPRAEGAHLNGVDCRATRCLLDVDFTNRETNDRVLSDFWDLLSSAGQDVSDLGFFVASRDEQPNGKIAESIHLYPVERRKPAP